MSEAGISGELDELQKRLEGPVLWKEPMSRHTSYGIGGPALGFFHPATENDMEEILRTARNRKIPVFFIGSGSNLLVSDDGFDGFVISMRGRFKKMSFEGTRVYAQGGTMMGHFVKECLKHSLTGVESLIGVPGTLGGAIRMNAGAYGKEISQFLEDLTVMTLSAHRKKYSKDEIEFGYRYSSLSSDEVILSANFRLKKGKAEEIQSLQAKASRSRKESQPLRFRSAGSVFKNPQGAKPAGYLIDQAGLKGTRRGGAEISQKHANFFLNRGNSSAEDIAWLIRLARKTVREKFGVELDLEIKTLGFAPGYFEA